MMTVMDGMTARGEMTGEAEMIEEAGMTEEVILSSKSKIGIVQNVVTLTFHSEQNVTAVAQKKVVAALAINVMIAGAETTDVAAETTDVVVGMTAEVIPITKIKIGIVQNVVIPTLHSELNVIAVVRKKAEEVALNAMTAEAEMTDVDEMTDVAVEKTEAEIIDVEETRAKIIVAPIQIMIGNVKSVTTQTSHSGRSVIAVVSQKVDRVKNHLPGGKAMIEDPGHEKKNRNLGLEIGIVLNVVNLISRSETTASVVAVQSA